VTAADVTLPSGVELAVAPETVVVYVTASPTEEQLAADGSGEVTAEAAEEAADVEPAEAPA
jgi:large subunit ribosomal protein L25